MAREPSKEMERATWLVDITRSSNIVPGILESVLRAGGDEHKSLELVIFAALEGMKDGNVTSLWKKVHRFNDEKKKFLSSGMVDILIKYNIDSGASWEECLLQSLKTFSPQRLFVCMNKSARRTLFKPLSFTIKDEKDLPGAFRDLKVLLLLQNRQGHVVKTEPSDLSRLMYRHKSAILAGAQRRLFSLGTQDASQCDESARSKRPPNPGKERLSNSVSPGNGGMSWSFSQHKTKSSSSRGSTARVGSNVSTTQGGDGRLQPFSWFPSIWRSADAHPQNAARRDASNAHGPSLQSLGRQRRQHNDDSSAMPRLAGRKAFVPLSEPLGAPAGPAPLTSTLDTLVETSPARSDEDPDDCAMASGRGYDRAANQRGGSPSRSPRTPRGPPRMARGMRGFVPQSAPLAVKPLAIPADSAETQETSSCMSHGSQSTDESGRSRESSPKSIGGSVYSWGSPHRTSTGEIPGTPPAHPLKLGSFRSREFTLDQLREATDNFAEENLIGKGTSGVVHKGTMVGCPAAIKRLNIGGNNDHSVTEKFQAVVGGLARMRHPHLVLLMGHCASEKAVVYEYMAGGTIEGRLKPPKSGGQEPLKWYDRIRIASEIGNALLFLHSQNPPIFHGDLRPENIFLDATLRSKLCDMGLAALLDRQDDMQEHMVNSRALRYVEPSELQTGEFTQRSDIYAFGLVLLQLLLGEPDVRGVHRALQHVNRGCQKSMQILIDTLLELVDDSGGHWPPQIAERVLVLALQCTSGSDAPRGLQDRVQPELQDLMETIQREQRRRKKDSGEKLLCPISKKKMKDPVVAADGCTYERQNIQKWLEGNLVSPVTGKALEHKHLVPNLVMKDLLESVM